VKITEQKKKGKKHTRLPCIVKDRHSNPEGEHVTDGKNGESEKFKDVREGGERVYRGGGKGWRGMSISFGNKQRRGPETTGSNPVVGKVGSRRQRK